MNLKFKIYHLTFIIATAMMTSCEKVIDIDLNTADPGIIIEGTITDQTGPYEVKLTQTVNYDEPNDFLPVSGAVVILTDNAGDSETLTETTEPGTYTTATMQGVPGSTYTLTVTVEQTTYTAISTMPQPVSIDTLLAEEIAGPHGNQKMIQARYTDPSGVPNFYRFLLFINGIDQKFIFIDDDRLQDGEIITRPVFSPSQQPALNAGDTATVYLQSIDENVYESFHTLDQMSSGQHGGSVSTANPKSNINNGALGYFNACAVSSKTIVVP